MSDRDSTLAALLTPPGTGALAVIAVRGPRAWPVVLGRFRPLAKEADWPPAKVETSSFWLGHFKGESERIADQVVLAVDRADDRTWLEIHCHGGREVVRWLLEILESDGIATVDWRELRKRTEDDVKRVEAEIALAEVLTARTAAIFLDQVNGAFQREVNFVLDAWSSDMHEARRRLAELAGRSRLGERLTRPWTVAVVGAPNVGKSALVNALAGYSRSIVAETPGTTRDIVTTSLAIDGWPMELWDTAGQRETEGALEGEGIKRARWAGRHADLALWVLDASTPAVWPEFPGLKIIVNKIDLPPAWNIEKDKVVAVSAKTGEGLPELCEAISRWLVPDAPPVGAGLPYTPDLAKRVREITELMDAGRVDESLSQLRELL